MGCIVYNMCKKAIPFGKKTATLLMKEIQKNQLPVVQGYSDQLNKLIALLVTKNPEQRPTIHEFLTKHMLVATASELAKASVNVPNQQVSREVEAPVKNNNKVFIA